MQERPSSLLAVLATLVAWVCTWREGPWAEIAQRGEFPRRAE